MWKKEKLPPPNLAGGGLNENYWITRRMSKDLDGTEWWRTETKSLLERESIWPTLIGFVIFMGWLVVIWVIFND